MIQQIKIKQILHFDYKRNHGMSNVRFYKFKHFLLACA